MTKSLLACLAVVFCVGFQAVPAHAGIVYNVSLNTTSINGTAGYLDMQFSSGPGALDATATVSEFVSDAILSAATPTNTTGSLATSVVFDNQTANDYLQGLTFGNSLSLLVTLTGPGVDTPPGVGSGSTFGIFLFDTSFNPLLGADPTTGLLGSVDLNNDGSTTPATDSPTYVQFQPETSSSAPEPGADLLLGLGALALGLLRKHTAK